MWGRVDQLPATKHADRHRRSSMSAILQINREDERTGTQINAKWSLTDSVRKLYRERIEICGQ